MAGVEEAGSGKKKKGESRHVSYYNRIILRGRVLSETRMLKTKNDKPYVSVRFGVPRGTSSKYGYDNFYLQIYGEMGNEFQLNVKQGDVLAVMGKLTSMQKPDEKGRKWLNNYVVVTSWQLDPAYVMTKKAEEGLNSGKADTVMEEVFDDNEGEFFW